MTHTSWCHAARRAALPAIHLLVALVAVLTAAARPAAAQTPDESAPAFSLSTSETFTTRDAPYLFLTFRHVASLDFRVYKVRDPFAFFAGLRDAHQFGSDAPADVPQEPTLIERLAAWKRRQRSRARGFMRGQVSHEYRQARAAARDKAQTTQRVAMSAPSHRCRCSTPASS